ncbi:MAG: alpha/beta hydrolase-fold protein [Pseudomonadota bacterium]
MTTYSTPGTPATHRWLVVTLVLLLATTPNALVRAAPSVSAGRLQTLPPFEATHVPARTVRVWLPPDYPQDAPYDVVYMHDGQMLFDATTTWNKQEWGVDETAAALIASAETRPFLVVAIDNGGDRRHTEYFPERPWRALPAATRRAYLELERAPGIALFASEVASDAYLRFIVEQLKPYVDAHYAVLTAPASTFLVGSSMGGLISLYGLLEYPEVFGGAACLSTHWLGIFETADNPVPARFASYLRDTLPSPGAHRLYFDHGDQGLDAHYPPHQRAVDEVMRTAGYDDAHWITRSFPGEDHSENAWNRRLDTPLRYLLNTRPAAPSAPANANDD